MKENTPSPVAHITRAGAIAALYVVLTLAFAPISYGAIQIRLSEALTILPLFTSAAVPGLFLGCIIANILGGSVVLNVVFGSLATLIGAALGYALRFNRWLVPLTTVLSNALIIPFVLRYGYGEPLPLPLLAMYIAAGEIAGSCLLGQLLATALMPHRLVIFKGDCLD